MKRLNPPASRQVAATPLTIALLIPALLAFLPSAPRKGPPPAPAPAPLASEDPPPLTPVLDPAPREPRPELRVAGEAPRLRGRS